MAKVLVFEDGTSGLAAARRLLTEAGHGVQSAVGFVELRDALQSRAHDVVLMALDLPSLVPCEALGTFLRQQGGRSTRLVLLSPEPTTRLERAAQMLEAVLVRDGADSSGESLLDAVAADRLARAV